MRIPVSLIRCYLDLDIPPVVIAEHLTLAGLEVDKIINAEPPFSGVVVGEVLSVEQHPNAERLKVAQVNDGKETLTVVCGAPNCRAGIKTAFARPGARLTGREGKVVKIEKAKLRGVESCGMLCSEEELSLESISDGILELPLDMKPGEDL
ncbi:MAG TPA: phenylalanine--tRNA ligase subunit beta, partial [Chlamydiales bacterium]|nr:phenylalanine--tRNA ligase subunit beta [Chlamydiales bacterium]